MSPDPGWIRWGRRTQQVTTPERSLLRFSLVEHKPGEKQTIKAKKITQQSSPSQAMTLWKKRKEERKPENKQKGREEMSQKRRREKKIKR